MFLRELRSRIVIVLLIGALAALASAAAATATTPTAAQVQAEITKAEHSKGLWATINICDARRHRNTIGIRGQMPALGFATTLQMQVELRYRTGTRGRWAPLRGSRKTLTVGTVVSGFRQAGVSFTVTPPAVLDATITFSWREGTQLLASVTHATQSGVVGVEHGDPSGFSAAKCRIGK